MFRTLLWQYNLLQTSHEHKCSPLCKHLCNFRLHLLFKDLLHTSQWQGYSSLCMCSWAFRWLPAEWLTTHITVIRTVCTMYKLMRLQTSLGAECFITHITVMWMVSTMHELMSVQNNLKTKRFRSDCRTGTPRWRPAQQPSETEIFLWREGKVAWHNRSEGEWDDCCEAGVKGVTVMEEIVGTAWLLECGNKRKLAQNTNLKMITREWLIRVTLQ